MIAKLPRISEHEEQASFFTEAKMRFGFRDDFIERLLFAVPNGMWIGGANKFALMSKYKAEGFKSGVSDVLYLQPRGGYNCLVIEMKALDKRNDKDAVTPEQSAFLEAINGAGGIGEVCYGCDEAIELFTRYMNFEAG